MHNFFREIWFESYLLKMGGGEGGSNMFLCVVADILACMIELTYIKKEEGKKKIHL